MKTRGVDLSVARLSPRFVELKDNSGAGNNIMTVFCDSIIIACTDRNSSGIICSREVFAGAERMVLLFAEGSDAKERRVFS